jgi:hypothetical protein
MAAPAPRDGPRQQSGPNIPDTSYSGPVSLQQPAAWTYDKDPASGQSRATYPGIVVSGGTYTPSAGGAVPAGADRVYVNIAAPVTLTLPANDCLVIDRSGHADINPITCNAPAGTTINGNPGYVIATSWGSAWFVFDGVNFGVRGGTT